MNFQRCVVLFLSTGLVLFNHSLFAAKISGGRDQTSHLDIDSSFLKTNDERHGGIIAFIPTLCDVNQDGLCTCEDIDDLTDAIANGANDDKYDLNEDGEVDELDRDLLITGEDYFETNYGDVNFDGNFSIEDLLTVDIGGEYQDSDGGMGEIGQFRMLALALDARVSYCHGDWNGDGVFDSSDIVFVFENGEFVPEPSSQCMGLIAIGLLVMARRGPEMKRRR